MDEVEQLIGRLKSIRITNKDGSIVEAINRLGELRDPRAVPLLIELLSSHFCNVVLNVHWIPARIAYNKKHGLYDLGPPVTQALVAIGEPALLRLIDEAKGDRSDIKQKAVTLLGRFHDRRAFLALLDCLRDPESKGDAISAIKELAAGMDFDLAEVADALKGSSGAEERSIAVHIYTEIAKARRERLKQCASDRGLLLAGETVKPPKKGLYRKMRRAVA